MDPSQHPAYVQYDYVGLCILKLGEFVSSFRLWEDRTQ